MLPNKLGSEAEIGEHVGSISMLPWKRLAAFQRLDDRFSDRSLSTHVDNQILRSR